MKTITPTIAPAGEGAAPPAEGRPDRAAFAVAALGIPEAEDAPEWPFREAEAAENPPPAVAEDPARSGVLSALALLPEKTILTEDALAASLGVSKRTTRRMISRFELPPPIRFGGRACWTAGAILKHFEARAERAAREAERAAERISRMGA